MATRGGLYLMDFADKIVGLLEEYRRASSVDKIRILITLRSLFQKATVSEGLEAIHRVRDSKDINVLLGVGMRKPFYFAIAKRQGELMGL